MFEQFGVKVTKTVCIYIVSFAFCSGSRTHFVSQIGTFDIFVSDDFRTGCVVFEISLTAYIRYCSLSLYCSMCRQRRIEHSKMAVLICKYNTYLELYSRLHNNEK